MAVLRNNNKKQSVQLEQLNNRVALLKNQPERIAAEPMASPASEEAVPEKALDLDKLETLEKKESLLLQELTLAKKKRIKYAEIQNALF